MAFPIIPGLAPLFHSFGSYLAEVVHVRNTDLTTETEVRVANKNLEQASKVELLRQQTQLKLAYINIAYQANLGLSEQAFQERMGRLQFGQQASLEEIKEQFQERLIKLNHKQQLDIQQFVQHVNRAINQQNQDLRKWCFEQENMLQEQLVAHNRKIQFALALYERETILRRPEAYTLIENWPLTLLPAQVLNLHQAAEPIPLQVIISPPQVDLAKFGPAAQAFAKIETRLAEEVGQLLTQSYPLNSQVRPTELLNGVWNSNRFEGAAAIKALFGMLKSKPTLILESELDGNYLNFRVAYWGLGQQTYCYEPIISPLPYRDILYDEQFEALAQILVTSHCIVAAWFADIHHLIHGYVAPQLPELLPNLVNNSLALPVPEVIQAVISGYHEAFEALKMEHPLWIPELSLHLAQSLATLPDPSWAKEEILYSLRSWLQQRMLESEAQKKSLGAMLTAMRSALVETDQDYLEKLKVCLAAIGEEQKIASVPSLMGTAIAKEQKMASVPATMSIVKKPTGEIYMPEDSKSQNKQSLAQRVFSEVMPIVGEKAVSYLKSLTANDIHIIVKGVLEIMKSNDPNPTAPPPKREEVPDANYFHLYASPPSSPSSPSRQWLHKSSKNCEGNLLIGDNGAIRCDHCNQQASALNWYLVDQYHLSDERRFGGQQLDGPSAASFAGQLTAKAGRAWVIRFLSSVGNF